MRNIDKAVGITTTIPIEVVFAVTLFTDLMWSAQAACVALFVTYLGIAALSKVIRWRRNRM